MSEAKKYTDTLDDWKSEYLPRLEKSYIYSSLKENCAHTDVEVTALVENAVAYSIQRTKTIIKHMGEYTLHDDVHLFRVLYLMERLLTKEIINNLSVPERMLLIISAFFHDIGMAPDEKEVLTWRKVWDALPNIENETEQKSFNSFKRFYDARPEQHEIIEKLTDEDNHSKAALIKSSLITEFIRQTHTERAREIIAQHWNEKIVYRNTDLTVELANICHSHTEDALKLLELDRYYPCGNNSYACLPLLGIILRLADILDFDAKRTPSILYSHLYVRNPVSLIEWAKHRSIENWEIDQENIQFSAKCTHPAIEASIYEFCNLIDHELSVCNNITFSLNEFNKNKARNITIKFPFKVGRSQIRTEKDIRTNQPKYTYRDTKFNLSKKQVIDLLMGTKLYGDPQVALRELLQNSIDACLLRGAQEKKWKNEYTPEITIKFYTEKEEEILEVIDNGTGMDQYIIDNYYTKVGTSFYTSIDYNKIKADTNPDFSPTSRFGIGILSCFMVADTLIVDTMRIKAPQKSSDAINLTVEGQDSIFWIKVGERETVGTSTKLILRKNKNPWLKMKDEDFIKSVKAVITNPPFKIHIQTPTLSETIDERSFDSTSLVSLKDYSWDEHESIRFIEIKLNKKETGIVGSATIAILEDNENPVKEIQIDSLSIPIEGKNFLLNKKLKLSGDKIVQESTSIGLDKEGKIKSSSSTDWLTTSKSKVSLHGIEVPSDLFPESWRVKNNQVRISWPFPMIIVLDISGKRDLDLNSSRTEIIMSEKWLSFEEELSFQICQAISENVSLLYWTELKYIITPNLESEQFLRGLSKVNKQ